MCRYITDHYFYIHNIKIIKDSVYFKLFRTKLISFSHNRNKLINR